MNTEILTQLFPEGMYVPFPAPRLVVVIPNAWDRYSDEEQQLLKKILIAIDQDLTARVVVSPTVDMRAIEDFGAQVVLVFGSEVEGNIPLYKESAAGGCAIVRADDLGELDDEKKKNLWAVIRKPFGK